MAPLLRNWRVRTAALVTAIRKNTRRQVGGLQPLRLSLCWGLTMKVISRRREQVRWVYNGRRFKSTGNLWLQAFLSAWLKVVTALYLQKLSSSD
jgi:hypothetical protein